MEKKGIVSIILEDTDEKVFNPTFMAYLKKVFSIIFLLISYISFQIVAFLYQSPSFAQAFFKEGLVILLIGIGCFLSGFSLLRMPFGKLKINSTGIFYRKMIWKWKVIPYETLKLVEIIESPSIIPFLRGTLYTVNVFSLDHFLRLNPKDFRNGKKIQEIFAIFALEFNDSLIRFFTQKKKQSLFRKLITDPGGLTGTILLVLVFFVYLWGAFSHIVFPPNSFTTSEAGFLKNPSYAFAFDDRYRELAIDRPPDSEFWFGTDFVGRDIFSRLVYSTFYTITVAIVGALIPITVGSLLGTISGFYGGIFDRILQSFSDSLMLIPPFALWMFAIALPRDLFQFDINGVHFEYPLPGAFYFQAFVLLAGLYWASPFRVIRQEVISIKEEEFVQVQYVLGSSDFRILRKHVLPNLLPPVFIMFLSLFVEYIVVAVSISIAIGLEGDLIWGSDISRRLDPGYYKQTLTDYFLLWSTLWIGITIFGIALFTDALKDALDPTARTLQPDRIKKINPAVLTDEINADLSDLVDEIISERPVSPKRKLDVPSEVLK